MALLPIEIHGRFLKRGNSRFLVRGVVYQRMGPWQRTTPNSGIRRPIDPISDDELPQLEQDVVLFNELGINTILVYNIDNTESHDRAMKLLEDAGIYVLCCITGLKNNASINRMQPRQSCSRELMAAMFRNIDIMAPYLNTMGVFVAYNLINQDTTLTCASVIKAVVRDVKRYMRIRNQETGQRMLPVGYSGSRDSDPRKDRALMAYLASGELDGIDFWGCQCFGSTEHCSIEEEKLQGLAHVYQNSTLPIIITEYSAAPRSHIRTFQDTQILHSPPLTEVLSGGCVYDFTASFRQYSLVWKESDANQSKAPEEGIRERRQTDLGQVVIYEDFENYRMSLEATREVAESLELGREDVNSGALDGEGEVEQRMSFLELDASVPESCVDWDALQ